ncbi:MAG: fibronectin type III domain-containing protein [Planctomycetes bacterium]|nr:fibronectin type III domain-containing protein [Planctomycetota bacterium]
MRSYLIKKECISTEAAGLLSLTLFIWIFFLTDCGGGSGGVQIPTAPSLGNPTLIVGAAVDGTVTLVFADVPGAANYELIYGDVIDPDNPSTVLSVRSPVVLRDLTNESTYFFTLLAKSPTGGATQSNTVNASPFESVTPPQIPVFSSAEPGGGSVRLTWSFLSDATGYIVYYKDSADVAPGNATVIPYASSPQVVTGLSDGVDYYFVLTAYNASGESQPSPLLSVRPAVSATPPQPPNLRVVSSGDGFVTLAWDEVFDSSSYNVYYRAGPSVTIDSGELASFLSSPAIIDGLVNGATYAFVATAVNSAGESEPSAIAYGTPIGLGDDVVLDVTATAPISSTGGQTPNISLSGVVDISHGGTGASSATDARMLLGLGGLATRNSIDESLWYGAPLSIASGGTGASTASSVRDNLGLGDLSTLDYVGDQLWSGPALSLAHGGTGATTAAGGRVNLGLGDLSILDAIGDPYWEGAPLSILHGGTGAIDGAGALASLGAAARGVNSDITSLRGLNSRDAIVIGPYGDEIEETGELRFNELEMNGGNFAGLRAPDSIAEDFVLTLPPADGAANEVLATDGAGNLIWTSPAHGEVLTVTAGGVLSSSGGASPEITLTGVVGLGNGGTGAATAAEARANLGLGSIALQDSDYVLITGGSIAGTSTSDFTINSESNSGTISASSLTEARAYLLPDAGGTFALTTDLHAQNTDVGTTSGSWTLNSGGSFATIDTSSITSGHAYLLPDAGGTFALTTDLHAQNTDTGTASQTWIVGAGGFTATLDSGSLTEDRWFTFPDASGTIVTDGINDSITSITGLREQIAIAVNPYGEDAGETGELQLLELDANGGEFVGFKAPDSIDSSLIFTLPSADGLATQVLTTDGAGNLGWSTPGGYTFYYDEGKTYRGWHATLTDEDSLTPMYFSFPARVRSRNGTLVASQGNFPDLLLPVRDTVGTPGGGELSHTQYRDVLRSIHGLPGE